MVFSEFNQKVVLITGAAGGIGSSLCRKFAEYNAIVYQTDIQFVDRPNFIQGDISDQEFLQKLVIEIVKKEGRIDVLVNNAGVCPRTPLLDISFDEWRKVMDINLSSTFFFKSGSDGDNDSKQIWRHC